MVKKKGLDTRTKMILVAERMFAEMGVYAISLRQINIEAGQRNGSALHYHFGSREGLISAIFEYRMEPINQIRLELLEEVKDQASPDLPDLKSLMGALLIPGTAHLKTPGSVTHFSRFLSQAANTYSDKIQELMDNKHNSGAREIRRLFRSALRDLPEPIIKQRGMIAEQSLIQTYAAFEALKEEKGEAVGIEDYDLMVANLSDCIYALLTAPVSEKTKQAADKLVG
ncbi:MAG: TetR/AcrR family transcriptional regulator [Alphaproteobacteria bacterium]|nr:TetR/AcrR family transcriptional regulator [Rhodospirillales bacterium]MCW9045327.1 TetR/AcrR family transcriptional regulator [Alphaproteobacteria bacterium]